MNASDPDADRNRPKRRIIVDGVYPQDGPETPRDDRAGTIENGAEIPNGDAGMPQSPVRPVVEGGPPLIRVEKLSIRFRRNAVLRDIDLTVRRGETVAIIGESGCGKTVFLKSLIDLLGPNDLEGRTGRVLFDGEDFFAMKPTQQTRQRIRFGFVFQQAALFDSMTVGENIAFPLEQHTDKSDEEIEGIAHALLAEVGLPVAAAGKYPGELSGGMRKRVGFARALAMNPEVMLYDEPTTGLDPIMSDVINDLIISTRRRHHVTGIMVTHDMKSARKVADRIVMFYPLPKLGPGEPQVIFDGTPGEFERCPDPRVVQFLRGEAWAPDATSTIVRAKTTAPKPLPIEVPVPEPRLPDEPTPPEAEPVEPAPLEAVAEEAAPEDAPQVGVPTVETVSSPGVSVEPVRIDTSQVAEMRIDTPTDVDGFFESGVIVDLSPGSETPGETEPVAEESGEPGDVEDNRAEETSGEKTADMDMNPDVDPEAPPADSYKPKYPV